MEFNTNQKLLSVTKIAKKKKGYHGDNYELRLEKWIMKTNVFNEAFKGPWTVYSYLWSNIIRSPIISDKYNIYENYYCNGQLACTPKLETISDNIDMSYNSVRRAIARLVEIGVVQKHTKRISKNVHKNIYILGFISPHTNKEISFLESLARAES